MTDLRRIPLKKSAAGVDAGVLASRAQSNFPRGSKLGNSIAVAVVTGSYMSNSFQAVADLKRRRDFFNGIGANATFGSTAAGCVLNA